MSGRVRAIAASSTLLVMMLGRAAWAQTTVLVNNLDAVGEGFNDPAPFTPVGGNSATTLGQARLNAFA